ncbi:hypothetical protein FXO38_26401 [Capsicum annuum]|nr:hypothetical protein FXO38_26401 [Capsicum annuum]KAF3634083.1 hypothetical protein FXO37_26678 [Capsicum annuum]
MQEQNVPILEDEVKFETSSQIYAKLQSSEIDLLIPLNDLLSRKIKRCEVSDEDYDLCREYRWGELSFDETISSVKSSLTPTKTIVGSSYNLIGFPYAFMKGVVEAFSLEHDLQSNNDSEYKRFSVLNQKLDKIQSTCSKKFKKILDENKFLKSKLSEIKTLLLGKLKADGDILSDKQPDNFQGEPSHDSMVDDQSDDPRRPTENERFVSK